MKFTVVIPYAYTGRAREESLEFVSRWWAVQGYPVLIGLGTDPWSKGAAVHACRPDVDTAGIIIADCDCIVSREAIGLAVAAVRSGAAWSMPHSRVGRLSRSETRRIYRLGVEHMLLTRQRASMHFAPPGGGIVVLSTTAYDTVGGIDPRFIGWGGEDLSFARALDTLAGPGVRLPAYLWHLWHPRTPRRAGNRASEDSERLAARYIDAEGDPIAMRALVAEHCDIPANNIGEEVT